MSADPVEQVVAHIQDCADTDAVIVVDGSADQIVQTMLAAGWVLDEQVDHVAGKRIRTLRPA